MDELKNLLGQYALEDVQSYKNLSVVPVKLEKESNIDYILFSEALDKNLIDIIETGVVNKLTIRNQAKKDVLVVKGEYVVGGKQNRVVSVNGLIGEKEIDLPVHCMEHGRWSYGGRDVIFPRPRRPRSPDEPGPNIDPFPWDEPGPSIGDDEGRITRPRFSAGQSLFSSAIRASISKNGSRGGEQSRTWNSINYLSESVGSFSATQDFDEILSNKKEDISEYMKNFKFQDSNGIIAKVGNVFYIDLFDKEESFRKHYEKILSSYIIDALATKRKSEITKISAREFLEEMLSSDVEKSDSLDLGTDYEILDGIKGSALAYKDTILYLGAKG